MMTNFRHAPTPRELDTFSAEVEQVDAEHDGQTLILTLDTETVEGYSVPVQLRFSGPALTALVWEITNAAGR